MWSWLSCVLVLRFGAAELLCPSGKYAVVAGWVDGAWGGCAACPAGKVNTDPQATRCNAPPGALSLRKTAKESNNEVENHDCEVSYWSAWSQCSKTCSFGGVQKRTRTVDAPRHGAGRPCPALTQERYCNAGRCPVRCTVSSWGAFSSCSRSCNGGTRDRTRTVLKRAPQSGGSVCPALKQRAQCHVVPCARNCAVGKYDEWSPCTASCGGGFSTRSRKALSRPKYGGAACPALTQHQNCGMQQCPADCVASVWSCGACTAACGAGVRPCTRMLITAPRFGGATCPAMSATHPCRAASCAPTTSPTPAPTLPPTPAPTGTPTMAPTRAPTPPPPFWSVPTWAAFAPSHARKGFCGDVEVAGEESGYLPVSKDRGRHLFFWFFHARPTPEAIAKGRASGEGADAAAAAAIVAAKTAPLVLVLGGDPGCSSVLSLLTGAGPCGVTADLGTKPNADSWTNHANVIWVEAPSGTGFSYDLYAESRGRGQGSGKAAAGKGDGRRAAEDFDAVGGELFIFVQEWLRAHPRFAEHELFIVAEGFASRYAPPLARRLLHANADPLRAPGALRVRLQGVALGSPALNQLAMYESYGRYVAHNAAHLSRALGRGTLRQMRRGARRCTARILECQATDADTGATREACEHALSLCADTFFAPLVKAGRSFADIRRPCSYVGGKAGTTNMCYDFSKETAFLRAPATRQQLGVRTESDKWRVCNHAVGGHFSGSWMRDADGDVPALLAGGVRLLVWASDFDYIANWIG